MGKGRGVCTRLGGDEGMLLSGELGAPSKELEVCFGDLEPAEERFYILYGLRFSLKRYEDIEGMKNKEEIFLI